MTNLLWLALIAIVLGVVAQLAAPSDPGPCCHKHRMKDPAADQTVYCPTRGH